MQTEEGRRCDKMCQRSRKTEMILDIFLTMFVKTFSEEHCYSTECEKRGWTGRVMAPRKLMSPEMKTPSHALKTAAETTPVTPVRLQPEL